MAKEFREFILRGNVVDMSVGIIVGAAFTKLVDSLVNDILMPPIGLLLGKVDFSNLFITLRDGAAPGPYHTLDLAKQAGAVTLNLGLFINVLISLVIVGLAVFMLIKALNRLRRAPAEAAPAVKSCPFCFTEIPAPAT
ncbi:MAG: large conductance mechanosensitive channel protein MscL, partial [Candidatus Adiutrix sp.]|nr:large conductance mechanosensitive channel protein MscL [Candidatus Adiutrix sp.]